MVRKKILVLGAGLAGLSVAWHLQKKGVPCQVFEKESEVGGLCRSKKMNGFTFDYDGHLLHFRHPYAFDLVRGFLKDNLAEHTRNAWIYSHGRFTHYPFQANLFGLPTHIIKECLSGFVEARNSGSVKRNGNFLRWIRGAFGEGIAKHFMIPYNTKFWTVPPQHITCDWLEGFIPQPTLTQVIAGSIEESRQQLGYNAHFWYPKKGGIGELPRAIRKHITGVHTGREIRKIDVKRKEVFFVNGPQKSFDHLISTIPLPELSRLMKDIPDDIRDAFAKLRWNSILNLNLGVRLNMHHKRHWIYFPQKDLSFFRVGFFHNFADDLCPEGCGSLYAEVAYSESKPIDKKKMIGRMERDLKKAGIISSKSDIVVRDINDIKYGYPIYDKNYASAREQVVRFLLENHISPCGRYGSWRYMSMEDVVLEGREVAERLIC